MSDIATLEKKLDRIERKLTELLTEKKSKGTWVKVSIIQRLTGWNREKMRVARDNNLVTHRYTRDNGHEYLLESLQPIALNK